MGREALAFVMFVSLWPTNACIDTNVFMLAMMFDSA